MPKKIDWALVGEVSVVDKGANLKGRFPITKELGGMDTEALQAILETPVELEAKLVAKSDKAKEGLAFIARLADMYAEHLGEDRVNAISAMLTGETQAEPAPEVDVESVAKKAEKAVKDEYEVKMKSLHEELKIAQKAVADLREQATRAEWRAKAEKDLSHYPGKTTDELVDALVSAGDTAEVLFDAYKAASDACSASDMLAAKGSSAKAVDEDETASGKISARAKSLADSEGISLRAARQRVIKEDPDLYRAYREEL